MVRILFLNPNHDIALLMQGTWLTRMDPRPQIEGTLKLGFQLTGGGILHWPIAREFHNSVLALLSPFLGMVRILRGS